MKEHTKKEIFSWIKTIVITIIIVIVIRSFLFTNITVNGDSMYPTFEDRDKLIVNRLSEIKQFDMVVFDAPDADELYIKRVIGLPGDHVKVRNDVLYINDEEIDEPYLEFNKKESEFGYLTNDFTLEEVTGETVIPEGMLFVMGDNRLYSKDSRNFGLISNDALIGEAAFRYFPFNKIGIQK